MIWQPVNLGGLTSTQQRGLRSSKEQLDLAAPSATRGPWLRPRGSPVQSVGFRKDPGMAVTQSSPRSQFLCSWLEGRLGGHCCQVQLGTGHALAVSLWESVTSCLIIFCTGPCPELALAPATELVPGNKAVVLHGGLIH